MRKTAVLAAALLLAAPLRAVEPAKGARADLLAGRTAQAVAKYGRVRLTRDPQVAAEFAYALAIAGLKDLALGHLDQAYALQTNNARFSGVVNFYASQVYALVGQSDIAEELAAQSAPRPAWIPADFAPAPPAAKDEPRTGRDFGTETALANTLMLQKRFYTAAERFQRITRDFPTEPLGYSGFAIALEKIGAFRKSARAIGRSLDLQGAAMPAERRTAYAAQKQELETRPQAPPPDDPFRKKANLALKGRYLAFLGGTLNRTEANTVSNINGRLGKFFTNRFDASLTGGYTAGNLPKKYRGGNLGIAGRYHQPLPIAAPVNATFGTRLEYTPRPKDKFSFILSPGVSWVLETGSLDLYCDYGASGPLKKTSTLSVGYTVYLGGRK